MKKTWIGTTLMLVMILLSACWAPAASTTRICATTMQIHTVRNGLNISTSSSLRVIKRHLQEHRADRNRRDFAMNRGYQ